MPPPVTLSLLHPKSIGRSLEVGEEAALTWKFLKLIEKLPLFLSLEIIQGLSRKINEWIRINNDQMLGGYSAECCFAVAVLEKSIEMSYWQQQQDPKLENRLHCGLWFGRLSVTKVRSVANVAPVVASGLPRLLLMLMTKGQFDLAKQVMNSYLGSSNEPTSLPLLTCLPPPFPQLFSHMVSLESLAAAALQSSSKVVVTDPFFAQGIPLISSIRSLIGQAPTTSPKTPTVNAFISSISSRCDCIESLLQRVQQQQQLHEQQPFPLLASPPWWSFLFVRSSFSPAGSCHVDVSLDHECVVYR